MCMLCGDTAEQGKREALYLADQLNRLAMIQKGLASGQIKPHDRVDVKNGMAYNLALSIIRNLVADYL